jgi:hypothetical protein
MARVIRTIPDKVPETGGVNDAGFPGFAIAQPRLHADMNGCGILRVWYADG